MEDKAEKRKLRKKRIWFLALAGLAFVFVLAVAVVAVVAFQPDRAEPEYDGKRLSAWLHTFPNRYLLGYYLHTSEQPEGEIAIRRIGSNAVPFLVKWVKDEPPKWRPWLSHQVSRISWLRGTKIQRMIAGKPQNNAEVAHFGFQALGPDAYSALPALKKVLNSPWNRARSLRVVECLADMGGDALVVLSEAATNRALASIVREQALDGAAFGQWNSTDQKIDRQTSLVPLLRQLANDPDFHVAGRASEILRVIQSQSLQTNNSARN